MRRYYRIIRLLAVNLLFLWACVTASAATTVVVGKCKPGVQYPTIQEAVNAVTASGTVLVCPGVYQEQVSISQPLTLQGLVDPSTGSGAVVIKPPVSGLTQNESYLVGIVTGIAAQIIIHNTTGPVVINDVIVDGSSASCPAPLYWVGIGVGQSVSATVTNSVVKNVALPSSTCHWGTAIAAGRGTKVKITNNSIHDCANGILVQDKPSSAVITGNNIARCDVAGATAAIAAGDMAGPLTISSNVIRAGFGDNPTSGSYGIFVGSSHDAPVTIYDNTVVGDVPGLSAAIGLTQVSKPIVLANRLSGAFVGISMQDVTGALISNNKIANSTTGISTGRPGAGNLIVGNSVNDASCGIHAPTTGANLFFNVMMVNCYATGLPSN